jgi:hypothetical protein
MKSSRNPTTPMPTYKNKRRRAEADGSFWVISSARK